MRIFLLLLSCVCFNFLEAGPFLLVNQAQGRHLEIQHSATHSNLTNLKLTKKDHQELIKEPVKLIKKNLELMNEFVGSFNTEIDLKKVWAKLWDHPLMLFLECHDPDCSLNRTLYPKPRRLFEEKVLAEAIERATYHNHSCLSLTFFGSDSLFDTLVHLAQILEKMPNLNKLEINLVDSVYQEYIAYIKDNNLKAVSDLTFTQKNKQNWYNFWTIRFAVFSKTLELLSPNTSVSLRIYGKLGDLSEDIMDATVQSTTDLVIAGDLFDGGGGPEAIHDVYIDGAAVTDIGATLLMLRRGDWLEYIEFYIEKLAKLTMAETSRNEISNVTYSNKDDRLEKMNKRFECILSHFKQEEIAHDKSFDKVEGKKGNRKEFKKRKGRGIKK